MKFGEVEGGVFLVRSTCLGGGGIGVFVKELEVSFRGSVVLGSVSVFESFVYGLWV